MRRYFGTDGIRGQVGDHPITPQFFLQLGWAVGRALIANNGRTDPLVLIGKDTRISGYMFESSLEAGLISAGVHVGLLGPMPTPAIAYLTRTFQASAGIVISASHNPFRDNGVKIFNTYGGKLDDVTELTIEAALEQPPSLVEPLGKARRISDAEGRYIEFCKGSLPWGTSFKGLKLVVDCANGATYKVAPQVFRELGAQVIDLHTAPDGLNINLNCGSTSMNSLCKRVVAAGADLGIAFDGDGDRVLFADATGAVVDGDQLLYIIAADQAVNGGCQGVVGTLMSNFGLELALGELGIAFARAKVGDRYVLETMESLGYRLGGESSGHIVCADATTTGDGIISALQVLRAIQRSGQPLHELKTAMPQVPQVLINVPLKTRGAMEHNARIASVVAQVEAALAGRGRVLLRPSGTEPVVRVMVEGEPAGEIRKLAERIAGVVAAEAG